MKVNDKIRMVRETKNWSQEDMADKLSMSLNGYAKLERGETQMNVSKLEKIAQLFDMDLIELLSVSEKGVVYVFGDHSTNTGSHSSNYYGASPELTAEIEKLKQALIHKDELLAQQARELKTLQTLVDTLQSAK